MKQAAQHFESRQSMNRSDFEIFHYKDRKPGCVELHHHDFYEVYCFLGGDVEYRVEGRSFRLKKGDLLLINPMELHQPLVLSDSTPYERVVLWIAKDFLASCSEDLTRCFDIQLASHVNYLHTDSADFLLPLLEALVREFRSTEYCSGIYAQGLFLQFMTELNRLAMQFSTQEDVSLPLSAQVVAYIGRHYREPLSLDSLAEHFYVSKYHLSHAFSKAMGVSVYRFLVLKRLQASREMLLEGYTPKDAFLASGFGDYANFYRALRQAYGVTPAVFFQQSPIRILQKEPQSLAAPPSGDPKIVMQ